MSRNLPRQRPKTRIRRCRAGGAFLGLAALALGGCQQFEPLPVDPGQSAAALGRRTLDDSGVRNFAGSPAAWGLDALTRAAFYFQPELDLARAQWAVAEAARITAGERPERVASLSPGTNTTTTTPSPRLVSATVDLTLETAGKRGYRIAEAAELAEAARLNVAAVAWQVQSRVRASLLDLYGALETERLLSEQQTIHANIVRILEGQHAAGAISAFELAQAQLASDSASLALADAERDEAQARARLAGAIGIPESGLDSATLAFDTFETLPAGLDSDETRERALQNRPDILVALAEYAASQSRLQLEIARQYPDLQLGPGYEYDQGDNKWSLGLSVSLPPDRNRGPIAEARARRAAAAARFETLQANVLAEIDLAVAAYRAARAKQAATDSILGELRRQQQTAQNMLAAGAIAGSELAALELQISATELARFDALLEVQRTVGQLEDAVQVPLGLPNAVWEQSPRGTESTNGDARP